MSVKFRRYVIRPKEAKVSIAEASEKIGINIDELIGSKAVIEVAEADFVQVILADKKPILFRTGKDVWPILTNQDLILQIPKVVVDMGAVPHLCNGADLMAPGIRGFEGDFKKDGVVVVIDEKHRKPIALVEAYFDLETVKSTKKGAVFKSVHYVGDQVWNFAKTLVEK